MKLFQSVLLLLALELQKSQAMKAARVLLFHSIVSVYSCDFTKHPLNVAESRKLKSHRWAHVRKQLLIFLQGQSENIVFKRPSESSVC